MKIIDADKLHYKQVYIQTEKGPRPALVVFAKEIRKMPEIVRCKDCLYRVGNACDYSAVYVRPNGFCQWGERREDDTK